MRDYSEKIEELYSHFDYSPALAPYISRGYSIERKQPFYGGFFYKFTFALKNGQEISFFCRTLEGGRALIPDITQTIYRLDFLSDFCSSSIRVLYWFDFNLEDNFFGELAVPDCMDYHFWLHPNGTGDAIENDLFRKRIGDDTFLNLFINDSRIESLSNSMLKLDKTGKITMTLFNWESHCFLRFSLKPLESEEKVNDFISAILEVSGIHIDVNKSKSWYWVKLLTSKPKFAKRPTISLAPQKPESNNLPTETELVPGDCVSHPSFGIGTVKDLIKAKGHIVINFKNVGEKTLAVYLTKLQKVDNKEDA